MTLLGIFWLLIGLNFLILIAIRFGFAKDLMRTIFWILVGVNIMTLFLIFWYGKY